MLPATSSDGMLQLQVVSDPAAMQQYFDMANANDIVIVDASGIFTLDLLQRIESVLDTGRLGGRRLRVVQVDVEGAEGFFRPADRPEDKPLRDLVNYFTPRFMTDEDGHLRFEAVRIQPDTVLALIRGSNTLSVEARDAQRVLGDPNRSASDKAMARAVLKFKARERRRLLLNADNPFIQKLATLWQSVSNGAGFLPGEMEPLMVEVFSAIHNSALFTSGVSLSGPHVARFGQQYAKLVERLVEALDRHREARDNAEGLEREVALLRPSARRQRDYIVIFYITPFRADLEPVRSAVREVVERRWECALVMATDEQKDDLLLENVRAHIDEADAFIADLSGLNPNVLFELGAVKFDQRERPVVLLDSGTAVSNDLPADLRGLLRIDTSQQKGDALANHLDAEMMKVSRLKELLTRRKRKRIIGVDTLRAWLSETPLDLGRIDLPRLAAKLRTQESWREARPTDIEPLLPTTFRSGARMILEEVQRKLPRRD
jgi:hypothetical protein